MEALIRQYEMFHKAKGLSEKSVKYYMWHLKKFLEYTGADFLDFGNTKKFRSRYYHIIARPSLCNDSKKKHLKCARIFADFLIQEEIIEKNAPREIDPPKVQKKLPIPVEDEELQSIFSAIDKRWSGYLRLRNTMIVELLLYTGLRKAELVALKRKNIQLDYIFVKNGKGGKDRTVYIPEHFSEKLQEYMKITAGVGEYLFHTNRSNKITESTINIFFKELKKKSGINTIYPHRLRHTFASRMLEQGIDLPVVRDQMGHQSITTTNRYTSVRDSHRKNAVQNFHF